MKKQTSTNADRNLIAIRMTVPTASAGALQSGEQSRQGKTIDKLIRRIQTSQLDIDHVSLCFQLDLEDDIRRQNGEGTP